MNPYWQTFLFWLLQPNRHIPSVRGPISIVNLVACQKEYSMRSICFLPTASVHKLWSALRAIASVRSKTRVWHLRVMLPDDLCRIQLPSALLQSNQWDHPLVDWQELCYRLIHPEKSTEYQWWQNRKKVESLNEKHVYQLLTEHAVGESAYAFGGFMCPRLFSCPGHKVSSEMSALLRNSPSSSLTLPITFTTAKGAQ